MKRSTVVLLIGLSAALWFISGAPLQIASRLTPPDRVYVPRIYAAIADTTAYYSNIEQARQGRLLFANQFTSEPQQPSLLHPLWLVTGWMAAITHWSAAGAFQAVRLLAIIGFVLLLWKVTRYAVASQAERWWILILVLTSSGLGWLFHGDFRSGTVIPFVSHDLWVAESNTFTSLTHSALFIGSQALLLAIMIGWWRLCRIDSTARGWWLPLALILLAIIHPYDILTVGFVIATWSVWRLINNDVPWSRMKELLTTLLVSFVGVALVGAYYVFVVLQEPAMSGWFEQNIDTTGPLYLLLLGWGLLFPLGILGAKKSWRLNQGLTPFLSVWFVVNSLLLYVPAITFQRRLLNGLHIPLAILAGLGLLWLVQRVSTRRWMQSVLLGIAVLGLSATNIKILVHDGEAPVRQSIDFPMYYPADRYQAVLEIGKRTTFDDVIFSTAWNGNTIAGVVGRTVVEGHGHQTLHINDRIQDWLAFGRADMISDDRTAMLDRLRVTWLFWTTEDQRDSTYVPDGDPRWKLEYQNPSVKLFRLQGE